MSSFVAFLSGADQYGRWVPDSEVTASAYLGGSTVDFSQALFKYPVVTIRSTAFWGSVTVIVPPNVAVEQDGSAILGGFGNTGGVWTNSNTLGSTVERAAVTIRIVGTALMGQVNVAVNHRAKPAEVLSAQEVERILREVPPEPSTTAQDFLAHALQAQVQAQQAQQAQQAAMAQAFAQAAAATAPGPDPRQALLQGLVTAQAQSGDPRAAVLQQVLNAQTASAPQIPPATAPHPAPAPAPVAAGGSLQAMD